MNTFVNTPEMDWFTAAEEGAQGGFAQAEPDHVIGDKAAAAATLSLETAPGYSIQPQTPDGTSHGTSYDTLLGCQFDTTSLSDADGPPTFEFKSGSRVLEYKESRSRRKRQIEVPQDDRLVCLWSPCKSTRTFGRVAELQRHYDEQHVRSRVFDCVAVDCPAKGLKGFTRMNKIFIHLETHHSKSTPFLCPVTQCRGGPFPADLLQVHIFWHNNFTYDQYGDNLKIILAGTEYHSLCPVQGCHEKLCDVGHTLELHHDIDTRKRNASAILAAGYNPTSGLPLCPVCNAEHESGLWSSDPPTTKHYLSHDWESLYKYRREILRVWPRFGNQSEFQQVFEDIKPTVDRADKAISWY